MITNTHVKIGVFAVIILVVIVFAFNRWSAKRSNFQWPVTPPSTIPTEAAADTAFQNTLNGCQDTYNQALISAGTNAASQLTAETVRATCIKTASTTYVTGRCPASSGTAPLATDPTYTFYTRYQTDIVTIQQAYVPAQRQIASTDTVLLNAARKSDMAGATRRYIASACPAFYKPSVATDPDPTATYSAWSTGESVTNGFKPSLVTVTSISTWADYAAVQYPVAEYFKSPATGVGSTTGLIKLTNVVGLVVGDAIQLAYKTPTTVTNGVENAPADGLANGTIASINAATNQITVTLPAAVTTGFVLAVDAVVAKALKGGNANSKWKFAGTTTTPNWKLSRDSGPGTLSAPVWATA